MRECRKEKVEGMVEGTKSQVSDIVENGEEGIDMGRICKYCVDGEVCGRGRKGSKGAYDDLFWGEGSDLFSVRDADDFIRIKEDI